ncbi:MAG: hypothetical protein DWC00_06190, partial [Candidatus Poseidoniales archaeon]
MVTGESFDLVADMRKGSVPTGTPEWQHGLDLQATERTVLDFNLSRLPEFTQSSRIIVSDILTDYVIDESEAEVLREEFSQANLSIANALIELLDDGLLTERELKGIDVGLLEERGITFETRRSWHLRTWLPQLPSGRIEIDYIFTLVEEVPTYDFEMNLEGWLPAQERFYLTMDGIQKSSVDLQIFGLDTSTSRDVSVTALFSRQENLTVPRLSVDMSYDIGQRLDYVYAVFNDKENKVRAETFLVGVPQQT